MKERITFQKKDNRISNLVPENIKPDIYFSEQKKK
jgi:hypothetical protein